MRCLTPSILVLMAALLMGCQGDAPARRALLDDQPLLDGRGRARSLVFDSPRLRALAEDPAEAGLPWYAARNDARLAVQAGVQSPVSSISRTYTVDRESFHNNRPHHHYQRTRVRYEVTTGAR